LDSKVKAFFLFSNEQDFSGKSKQLWQKPNIFIKKK